MVGEFAGLLAGGRGGGDGEDSAAVGVEVAFGHLGAGVVDLDIGDVLGVLNACDDITDAWVGWVVFGSEDHGDRVVIGEADVELVECSCGGCDEELECVGFEACEEGLAFGITETDIELKDFGTTWGEHDTGVEDAFEVDLIAAECVCDGDEDFGLDLVAELVGEGS